MELNIPIPISCPIIGEAGLASWFPSTGSTLMRIWEMFADYKMTDAYLPEGQQTLDSQSDSPPSLFHNHEPETVAAALLL